jgi:hypothetical protein
LSTFKGAAGAAARDAAIGALTGAAVGSVRGPGTPTTPLTEEGETAPPPPPPPGAPTVTPPGGISPEAMDLETLLSAGAPVADETIDFETPTPAKTSGKTADELITDNARIQAKLDAGEYKNPKAAAAAKAKQARQQAEIDAQAAAPIAAPEVIAEQAAAPVKESIYEVPKKEAGDYVAAIESQTVKPNASILKKHVKAP